MNRDVHIPLEEFQACPERPTLKHIVIHLHATIGWCLKSRITLPSTCDMTQSTYHVSVYMLNTTSHTREELVRQELWLRQVKVAIACPWNANFTKWDHHSPYDLVHAIAFERCSGGGGGGSRGDGQQVIRCQPHKFIFWQCLPNHHSHERRRHRWMVSRPMVPARRN